MREGLIGLLVWSLATPASALCPGWSSAQRAGALDTALVDEASGLEVSARYPNRLYHNNDSGDGLRFYVSDLSGGATRAIEVEGAKPRDMEEMSLGPCGRRTCLYLGDIGDNPAKRDEVAFTLVLERESFPNRIAPLRTVRARYPDGPHNAEAFAVHPNGDLYLVTKPADARMMTPGRASVFRLNSSQLRDEKTLQTFAKAGEIDLPTIMAEFPFPGSIATALDFTADGERTVLLTYIAALEFDFSQGLPQAWTPGVTYNVVRLNPQPQQEAAAWLPDGSGFLVDTEMTRNAREARIDILACKAP